MSTRSKIVPLVGLRAIAVAWVVAFHYWPTYADGGFVGVDLFFVLSGFLITTILLRELDATGSINFFAFLKRRTARLAPALCLVVLAVALAAHLLPAITRHKVLDDLPWVLSYTSNWKRAFQERFGDSQFFNHSWSLGIEEQFYLAWPPILAVLYKRWSTQGVLIALLLMIAGVMWWRLHLLALNISFYRLYHGSDTRADQLLIGCALAAAMSVDRWRDACLGILRRCPLVPILMLGLLPFLEVLPPESSIYWFAFSLTAVGFYSAIIVIACHITEGLLARILSSSILVRLGTISYGIYLWHIPLKSFFLATRLGFDGPQKLLCLSLTIIFAAASFYLVENRFLSSSRQAGAIKAQDGADREVREGLVAIQECAVSSRQVAPA